ncbi:hypothetical protein [Ethanoligenens sp.]|uniref:hypothetical protein n=1 Tax=Ethanoligenens sp. TaxID=2099655 RepID=UPI0039E9B327
MKKQSMPVDMDPQELAAEIGGSEGEVGKVSAKTNHLEKQVWNYMHARAKLLSMLHMPVERTERERRIREKER